MGEPIKIVVTAETAAAAAALQQFVQNTGAGLKTIAAVGDEAAHHMGGVVYQFRSAIDAIRFAAMDGGPRAAFYAVDEAVRGLVASGMTMSTLIPVIGGVGLAGVGLYGIYKTLTFGQDELIRKNNELTESYKQLPEVISHINNAFKSGFISSDERDKLLEQIGVLKKIVSPDEFKAAVAGSLGGGVQAPQVNAQFTGRISLSNFGLPDQHDLANANEELAKMGYLLKSVDDKGKTTYTVSDQGNAILKIEELQKKIALERLAGFDRERAAAKQTYDSELAALNEYIERAGDKLKVSPDKLRADLAGAYSDQVAHIASEADAAAARKAADAARQQAEAEKQIREQYAEQFRAANKVIEDQITGDASAAGKQREDFYFRENVEKMAVATKFLIEGKISNAEYTDAVAESQKELLAGVEKQNAEYFRQLQLKRELARADAEVQLKRIQTNPFLTDTQKQQQSVPALQQEMAANDNSISDYQRMADTTKDDAARIAALTQIDDLKQRQVEIQNELNAAENANNFSYQLGEVMVKLQNIGTVQQQAAQVFSDVWTTAASSMTENFSQFIEKHQTWGETLRKIYKSVVDSFIQGMTKMAVEFVMNHGLMAEISAAWHAIETGQQAAATSTQVAIHASGETAKTGVTAAGATMRGAIGVAETVAHSIQVGIRTAVHAVGQLAMTSITFTETLIRKALAFLEAQPYIILAGIEAAAAVASIPYVGPILAPIAAATTIAALEGLAAFAEGGRPPVGVPSIIGEKGWELFVPDTAGTIVSHDKAVSMLNSSQREANNAGSRGAAAAGKTEVHNFIYHDKAQLMEDLAKSAAFEKNVVDVMNRTIHKFR
jgi:hypothetical protein